MKKVDFVILLAAFLYAFQVKAQSYQIGDVIQNSDGSQGVVFYINPSRTGGWMVALQDASPSCPWGTSSDIPNLNNYNPNDFYYQVLLTDLDGFANTQTIRNYQNNNNTYAAGKVDINNGWYLPSTGQLQYLFSSLTYIEPAFANAGGTTLAQEYYWSSTERTDANAWVVCFGRSTGIAGCYYSYPKTENHPVRAVRDFDMVPGELTYQWSTGATTQDISVSPTQTTLYSVTVSSGAGCESTATKTIIVNPNYNITVPARACDNYVWNGVSYNASGAYSQEFESQQGCDSIVTLNLTVNHSATTNLTMEACEPYVWYGTTYSQSGIYEHMLQTSGGCDSLLVLDLTIGTAFSSEENINACESYVWRGTTYSESGTYTETVQNPNGCDSTFILHLTVNHGVTTNLSVETCEPYVWYGTTYSQSGIYEHMLQTSGGCDSLLVLDLTIGTAFSSEESINACDSYVWRGTTYSESGIYTENVQNPSGCDSTFVLNLTVYYSDTVDYGSVSACDAFEWHGTTYTQGGMLTHQTTNENGCDRLERLQLTIHRSTEYEFNVTSCESYEWYGVLYEEPGVYQHILTSAQGCDSLLIMHLDIGETFVMEENVVSCGEYGWHGTTYTESGDYQLEVQNPMGCDSLFVLHLAVDEAAYYEFEQQSCGRYTWNGMYYDVSGDYQQVFTTAVGCDSVVVIHLSVLDSYTVEIDTLSCGPLWWQGELLNESGDYPMMLQSVAGCDSLVVLHLTAGEGVETAITGSTAIYPATNLIQGVYSYHIDSTGINPSSVHWSIDPDDWFIYPHGASCDLVCTTAGVARLRAWTESESCNVDTTLVIYSRFYDVEENGSRVSVYPNPTKGTLHIEAEDIESVRLIDMVGQVLEMRDCGHSDGVILDLNDYARSVYLLEIKTDMGMTKKRVILCR